MGMLHLLPSMIVVGLIQHHDCHMTTKLCQSRLSPRLVFTDPHCTKLEFRDFAERVQRVVGE